MSVEKISICTGVQNRLHPLLQVLPTWLATKADEILIVDWSSDEHVADQLKPFHDTRLKIIRIKNEPEFRPPMVWNLAIRLTSHSSILKVDGDIFLATNFFTDQLNDLEFRTGHYAITGIGTYGTVLLRRKMFDAVNGYNERMKGWGFEDRDLYLRLGRHGFKHSNFNPDDLNHLDHSDKIRLTKNVDANIELAKTNPWCLNDQFYQPEIEYIKGN